MAWRNASRSELAKSRLHALLEEIHAGDGVAPVPFGRCRTISETYSR